MAINIYICQNVIKYKDTKKKLYIITRHITGICIYKGKTIAICSYLTLFNGLFSGNLTCRGGVARKHRIYRGVQIERCYGKNNKNSDFSFYGKWF